jgi:hypothetical protein
MVWWDERSAGLPTDRPPRLAATVDLEDPYLRSIVLDALTARPAWRVTSVEGEGFDPHPVTSTSRLHWGEYERVDWGRVHEGATTASSYCVRKGLTRKAQLAVNLKKWVSKRPASPLVGRVPETHILAVDDPDYIDEAMADIPEVRDAPAGAGVWIVKPSLANRAAGIAVIDSAPGLRAALAAEPDLREWVVQRYVHPPHLLGGKKWHLRVYALAVGALTAYCLTDGLVLRARAPYGGAGYADLDAHLTNTCRQGGGGGGAGGATDSDGDARPASPPPPRPASPRPDPGPDTVLALSELVAALTDDGMEPGEAEARVAALRRDVAAIVGETFAAVTAELSFFALPSAFELFGFDVVVDAEWRAWLLEVNADPDVGATGTRLRPLILAAVDGALALVADPLAAEAGWEVKERRPLSAWPAAWEPVFAADAGRGGGGGMRVF